MVRNGVKKSSSRDYKRSGRFASARGFQPCLERFENRTLLSTTVAEFPIRTQGGGFGQIVADNAGGNLWYVENSNNLVRYNPTSGVETAFQIPTYNSGPTDLTLAPNGKIWFLEATANQIGELDPSTGTFNEYPLLATANAGLTSLTFDASGNVWFTEFNNTANAIGEFNPTTQTFNQFTLPTLGANPYGIVYNPVDGNIWFTEQATNQIGYVNPSTGQVVEKVFGTGSNLAQGITVDPFGNLYFAESGSAQLGEYNLAAGTFSTIGLSAHSAPTRVIIANDGNLWFSAAAEAGGYAVGIGKYNLSTQAVTQVSIGGNLGLGDIASLGTKLWVTELGSGVVEGPSLGSYDYSSKAQSSFVPSSTSSASQNAIYTDSNGDLWFGNSNQIGFFDPTSQISTEYALPATSYATTISSIIQNPTDGTIYLSGNYVRAGFGTHLAVIDKINPVTRVVSSVAAIPTSGTYVDDMTYDAKNGGYIWFTEPDVSKIGYLNLATLNVSDNFTLPAGSTPNQITVDPTTGDLWFTESGTGKVGIFDPSANQFSSIALSSGTSNPIGIVYSPSDQLMYVAEANAGKMAILNPATQTLVKESPLTTTGGLTIGPDGNIWASQGAAVVDFNRATYAVTTVSVPNESPIALTTAGGNLWFTATPGKGVTPAISAIVENPTSIPTQLAFATQPPVGATTGVGFGVVVSAENSTGTVENFVDGSSVTLTLSANPGSNTTTSWTATVSQGKAVFAGIKITNAAAGYKFTATLNGLSPAVSSAFSATLGANHLGIPLQPPASVNLFTQFPLTISALDANNNIDTSYTGPITVALSGNPNGATLGGALTENAVAGQAVFTDLTLNQLGANYAITASTYSLRGAPNTLKTITTSVISVVPSPASKLVITTTAPTSINDGQTFGFVVSAEDFLGNVVTSYNGTATVVVNSGGADLSGVQTVNFVNGVATFSGLYLDKVGTNDVLGITSGTLTSTQTAGITVTQSPATKLAIISQPSLTTTATSYAAGAALDFVVKALDPLNNIVTNFAGSAAIAISNNPASGTLHGTLSAAFSNGQATLTGLYLDKVGQGYTFQISSNGLTGVTTNPINITIAPDSQLVVTSNPLPSPVVATQGFGFSVQAEDPYGNIDPNFTGTVTAALLNNAGGSTSLGGTTSAVASGGIAGFTGLTLNKAGSGYTIQVTSPSLANAVTNAFNVIAAPATRLVFTTQPPSSVLALSSFGASVEPEDPNGNIDYKFSGNVTVALTNPGSATLGGTKTLTIPVGAGIVNFSGLNISTAGSYTLQASSGLLTSATSSAINVAPTASQLVFTSSPPSGLVAGQTFSVTVAAEDATGHTVTGFTGNVVVSLGANSGGSTFYGTQVVALVNGAATFSNLSLSKAGTGYTLTASASKVTTATTSAFNIAGLSISGVIFNDTQATGVLVTNGNDPGLAGRVVFLDSNNNGILDSGEPSTTTGANGRFTFSGLSLGTHVVRTVTYPGDLTFGPSGAAATVNLTTVQPNATVNVGLQPTSLLAPFHPNAAPFGTNNPNVATAEVKAVYQLVLGRTVDPAGLANAVAELQGGATPAQLASQLLLSTEYFTDVVSSFYVSFLGRVGAASDIASGAALLKGGMNTADLAEFYLTCPEFNLDHPGNLNFVQTEYHDVLGREPSSQELSAAVTNLNIGGSRTTFVNVLIKGNESVQRAVSGFYTSILARPGDPAGIAANVQLVQSNQESLITDSLSFFAFTEFANDARKTVV